MKLLVLAAGCIAFAGAVYAQSNMEKTVIRDMQRMGYPAECIAKLTTNDAAYITSTRHDREMRAGEKNRKIRDRYRRICER